MPITTKQLLAFVGEAGGDWRTPSNGKIFSCVASDSGLDVTPASTRHVRHIPCASLDSFCQEYNRVESWSPAEYKKDSFNASYLLSIVKAMQLEEAQFKLPEELALGAEYFEGAVRVIQVNAYERSPQARRECVAAHGASCVICGMDFEASYGPMAKGFIHVHHLRPLSMKSERHTVDPVVDLRPVCPNCHAVIHLGGGCRSIEEVAAMLSEAGSSGRDQRRI